MITFKHSGCIGDLILSLPVIKYYGGGDIFLANNDIQLFVQVGENFVKKDFYEIKVGGNGRHKNGLSNKTIEMLEPLLSKQKYIDKVFIWEHQLVDFDLDAFRLSRSLESRNNLTEFIAQYFSVPLTELREPWLDAETLKIADYVFHFSVARHQNRHAVPYVRKLLKTHRKNSVFLGHEFEWKYFCNHYGDIEFYRVNDFLEMASIINGARFFVGNQSCGVAMAVALGKPFFQMVSTSMPDCIFTRKHCYYLGIVDKKYIGLL